MSTLNRQICLFENCWKLLMPFQHWQIAVTLCRSSRLSLSGKKLKQATLPVIASIWKNWKKAKLPVIAAWTGHQWAINCQSISGCSTIRWRTNIKSFLAQKVCRYLPVVDGHCQGYLTAQNWKSRFVSLTNSQDFLNFPDICAVVGEIETEQCLIKVSTLAGLAPYHCLT